jgi:hypothetical protein
MLNNHNLCIEVIHESARKNKSGLHIQHPVKYMVISKLRTMQNTFISQLVVYSNISCTNPHVILTLRNSSELMAVGSVY